ncbi:MAG: hypothetical protein PHR53_00880 [Bacteroidales bacterium]|nr:hypothetical protein [Bacteroidales bacterium]
MNPQLFTETLNTKAEELKKYLPVNVNLSFKTLSPYLASAEKKYIIPLLGNALFSRLVSYYQAVSATPPSENAATFPTVYAELLSFVQFSLVRLAYWSGYDVLSVSLSDSGASTKVAKENQLYRYQHEAVKRSLKTEGFDELDVVLEWVQTFATDFPEYSLTATSLIRNTTMFNDIYNINRSRLVFLKMVYYMTDVEQIDLRHRLGNAFVEELISCDESLPKYASIMGNIRKFVVFQSLKQGVSELKKLPTEKGILFEQNAEYSDNQLPEEELQHTIKWFGDKAERYLSAALQYINNNINQYPAYAAFAGAQAPVNTIYKRDNTNRKTFVV